MDSETCPLFAEKAERYLQYIEELFGGEGKQKKKKKTASDKKYTLLEYAEWYQEMGCDVDRSNNVYFKEYIEGIESIAVIGEFNQWDQTSHIMKSSGDNYFHLIIPSIDGECMIDNKSKIQYVIKWIDHTGELKTTIIISPWARVLSPMIPCAKSYDPTNTAQIFINPNQSNRFKWKYNKPRRPNVLKIYEFHLGMMLDNKNSHIYSTYNDIVELIPYIADTGYNCVQIMGAIEHTCYESYGYLITNYFAPSNKFGSSDEFKHMIDIFHKYGIHVLLDIVHTHAARDGFPGLAFCDGHSFFFKMHQNSKWGTPFFNYANPQVSRFLLSNLMYWLDQYMIDGFRFDSVNEVLYSNGSVESYEDYFDPSVESAHLYLTLANHMIHQHDQNNITIAEDYFGLPRLCSSHEEGGLGFDYRQQTGIAEYFQSIFEKHTPRSQNYIHFDLNDLTNRLKNRRSDEKTIIYMESHDQQIMGHKTFAQHLMGDMIYKHMERKSIQSNQYMKKMIGLLISLRTLIHSYVKGGVMTFAGNEFMHPNWLEFPSIHNKYNYKNSGRQWDLLIHNIGSNKTIRHDLLYSAAYFFERSMMNIPDDFHRNVAQSIYNNNEIGLMEIRKGKYIILINLGENRIIHHSTHIRIRKMYITNIMDTNQYLDLDPTHLEIIDGKLVIERMNPYSACIYCIVATKPKQCNNMTINTNILDEQQYTQMIIDNTTDHSQDIAFTESQEIEIKKKNMVCFYTYDHYKEEEMMYLAASILSLIKEMDNAMIIIYTTTYDRVVEEIGRYHLTNHVMVIHYHPSVYGQTIRDVASPDQKYFNCIGHSRIYIVPYLLNRFNRPVIYLDNDTGILHGKGKDFIETVMREKIPIGFRMEKWTTLHNLYAEMNLLDLIKEWKTNIDTHIVRIDDSMRPINNGILIFQNTEQSIEFSEMCRKVFEEMNREVPCKFNDMAAFTIVWHMFRGRCLVYNENFGECTSYEYNGEIVIDEPNYTAYHYYLEKYQDNKHIIYLCKEMIGRYIDGQFMEKNKNKIHHQILDNMF